MKHETRINEIPDAEAHHRSPKSLSTYLKIIIPKAVPSVICLPQERGHSPTLDNPILPFFNPGHWRLRSREDDGGTSGFTSVQQRDQWLLVCAPALRLASLFLSTDSLMDFWTHLLFSETMLDSTTGKEYLKPCSSPFFSSLSKAETIALTKARLADVAARTHFQFFKGRHFRYPGQTLWGICYTRTILKSNTPGTRTPSLALENEICLWSRFKSFALSPTFVTADSDTKRGFYLQLAIILCHEFAHAVYNIAHRCPSVASRAKVEPFYSLSCPVPEIGTSWEMWVWRTGLEGSKVIAADVEPPRSWNMVWYDRRAYLEGVRGQQALFTDLAGFVDKSAVERIFRKETWEAVCKEGRVALGFMLIPSPLDPYLRLDRNGKKRLYGDIRAMNIARQEQQQESLESRRRSGPTTEAVIDVSKFSLRSKLEEIFLQSRFLYYVLQMRAFVAKPSFTFLKPHPPAWPTSTGRSRSLLIAL